MRFTVHENKAAGQQLRGPADIVDYIGDIKDADQESFWLMSMDSAHKIIECELLFLGGMASCDVDPRIVFKRLLTKGAAAFIIAHNHPTGSLEDSPEDREITKRLKAGADLLGIRFLDHILIAGDKHKSIG